MLYSFQKVYYDIIYHNKTCVKNYLNATFVPIAIPSDAKHRAQVVLGSLSAPAEGLLVNNWVGSDAEINGKLKILKPNITIIHSSVKKNWIHFPYLFSSKLLPDLYRVRLHPRRHCVSHRWHGSLSVKVCILIQSNERHVQNNSTWCIYKYTHRDSQMPPGLLLE